MKSALVIGGTGFIGIHVVDALLEANFEVSVTRRKSSVTLLVRKRPVALIDASVEDANALTQVMMDHDVVVYCGGYYPRYSTNLPDARQLGVMGVRNVLLAARTAGVPRVLYTSTTGTLEAKMNASWLDEGSRTRRAPIDSVYRNVKWHMEQACDEARALGLDVVTMLPGGCVGPWDLRLGTAGLLVAVLNGQLSWMVDGIVNLADVRDVARAHAIAASAKTPSDRYCLSAHSMQLRDLVHLLVDRYGGRAPRVWLDAASARARADEDELRAERLHHRVAVPRELVDVVISGRPVSSQRARKELAAEFRPLLESLDDAVEWLARHRFVPARVSNTKEWS